MQTWYEVSCPECKKSNFVCAGDVSDPTGYDPVGVRCCNCKHCWLLDQDDDYGSSGEGEEEEDPRYDDGKPYPSNW